MQQDTLFADIQPRLVPPRSLWKLRQRGVFLGTSGYSYEDWVGPFYPRGTRKPQMLEYYQHFFAATELNYTYYTMPRASTLFQIRNRAPHMQFSVKAHQSLTHERRGTRQSWQDFADAMTVLSDTGQLACLLFQFPYSFKCSNDSYAYLDEVIDYFDAFHIVLEFRHVSWHNDATYDYSKKRGATLCSIDAPRLPGLTGNVLYPGRELAYYRLHGRNAQHWFDGDNVTRYDYRYSPAELNEIINNVIALVEASQHVFLFANNHPRAQAVETVIQIAEALEASPALAAL